ncbi:FHA domain-containing protein [bacterium]|nr:FHA domain-containing protein [bacterium]MCK5398466.1 FHA domain-containing protein [bacterium]MCK5598010.1 FHA domain-containing protein [bacterium]
MMKFIYFTSGILEGSGFPLKDGMTVGRAPENNVVIKDNFVSKLHSAFSERSGDMYLIDKKSHNGIFVNNLKYRVKRLHPGDRIKIGKNIFIYYEGEEDLLNREYELFKTDKKVHVKDELLKIAEFHEKYLKIFYRIISPYLQSKDSNLFWKTLKDIIYRFNIENFLLARIKDNKLEKTDIMTSFYDKAPQIKPEIIEILKQEQVVTLVRGVKSIKLREYLLLYPYQRGGKYYVWVLGRFVQGEMDQEDLNQLYFTGLILSFLK